MSARAREYRLLIDDIIADNARLKAMGFGDLVEPEEWQQLRDIVGSVVKKLERDKAPRSEHSDDAIRKLDDLADRERVRAAGCDRTLSPEQKP